MVLAPLSPSMVFTEASARFLQLRTSPVLNARVQYISPRTLNDYRYDMGKLNSFFGKLPLEEIHLGHLFEYQRCRSVGEGFFRVIGNRKGRDPVPSPAGACKVNREIDLLIRVLKAAGCWTSAMDMGYVRFQRREPERPRALSPQQQERFLCTAATRPEWHVVWWYSLVALDTTFSTDELRTLRIGDINLVGRSIAVNSRFGKNRYRRRTVMIEDASCIFALERLMERAADVGATGPHHHLFPYRTKRNTFDPDRPMSPTGIRKPFEEVRMYADVPWFPLNGWRHTAITRLAEQGRPMAFIKKKSGHVTDQMCEHYTHISEQAELAWVEKNTHRRQPVSVSSYPLRRAG